jgi:hypothetical protein
MLLIPHNNYSKSNNNKTTVTMQSGTFDLRRPLFSLWWSCVAKNWSGEKLWVIIDAIATLGGTNQLPGPLHLFCRTRP